MPSQSKKITAIRGMYDIMPPESVVWQHVEDTAARIFATYGYREVRIPVVEEKQLFVRSVGKDTDIVTKEMYDFEDRNGLPLALRPEGTASVVRAYIESGAHATEPLAKYWYRGPMFRYERPQKGRQRQFYQIGAEILGVQSPQADAEVIAMMAQLVKELELFDVALEINSIGCSECRPGFNDKLISYLKSVEGDLCADCKRRMQKNPLRVFDCKVEGCQAVLEKAPRISQSWCGNCSSHFEEVQAALKGVDVDYVTNDRIVRGLDYYMRTAFEFTTTKLGAQNAISAGGRYDGLVRDLGGPDIPGVGFALGMERLILLLTAQGKTNVPREDLVYCAVLGENALHQALPIIQKLRSDGVRVEWDFASKSLKAQMRRAGKLGAESVIILGDDELKKGVAVVRDMRAKTQHEVRIDDLPMHFVQIGG
jgi:histidyl-tRNA synthetase